MADGPSTQVNDWQEVNDWQDTGSGASTPSNIGDFRKLANEAMTRSGLPGTTPQVAKGKAPSVPYSDPVNAGLVHVGSELSNALPGLLTSGPWGKVFDKEYWKQGLDQGKELVNAIKENRLPRAVTPQPTWNDVSHEAAGAVGINSREMAQNAREGNYPQLAGDVATTALQLLLAKKVAGKSRVPREQLVPGKMTAPAKMIDAQASNLASAVERGATPPQSASTFEDVTRPIMGRVRQIAAKEGITPEVIKGREGYGKAADLTGKVRADYDARYNSVIEPLKDMPASEAARKAASSFTDKVLSDAELVDELLKGDPEGAATVTKIKNIRAKIESSSTIGELDELRQSLNRLASKTFAQSGEQQYRGSIFNDALREASNSVRNELYSEVGRRGAMPEADIRTLQKQHGAAIQLDNMMQQTARAMSSSASGAQAGPSFLQSLRGQAAPFEVAGRPKLAATAVSRRFFKPVAQHEIFNTEVQRALKGATPPPPESTAKVQQSMIRDSFKKNMSRYTPPKQEVKPPDVWDKIEQVRYMESDIAQLEREVQSSTDPIEHRQLQGRLDFLREKLATARAAAK